MVVRAVDMKGQELHQSIRFSFLQLSKACAVSQIHVQRLQPRYRMRTNGRMMSVNWRATRLVTEVVLYIGGQGTAYGNAEGRENGLLTIEVSYCIRDV